MADASSPTASTPVLPGAPMVSSRYRVVENRAELAQPRTATLALEPLDTPIASFGPGQFTMLWAIGVGEVPVSISGDPAAAGPLVHTIRAVGPVTEALCDLSPGAIVGVRGPFGNEWAVRSSIWRDIVFVAGGLGLAPLRPAILAVLRERERFGRVSLVVGARSPDELLFSREMATWADRGDIDLLVTVDRAGPEWDGDVGVVTLLVPRVECDPSNTTAFVCGPEVMMRFVAETLVGLGIGAGEVWVSLERNMKCAVAHCGHCQLGPELICRDGPVFSYSRVASMLRVREL